MVFLSFYANKHSKHFFFFFKPEKKVSNGIENKRIKTAICLFALHCILIFQLFCQIERWCCQQNYALQIKTLKLIKMFLRFSIN